MARANTSYSEIERCGIDIEVEITWRMTYAGCSASWFEPAEAPEFEIDKVCGVHSGIDIPINDLTDEEYAKIEDSIAEECAELAAEPDDPDDW